MTAPTEMKERPRASKVSLTKESKGVYTIKHLSRGCLTTTDAEKWGSGVTVSGPEALYNCHAPTPGSSLSPDEVEHLGEATGT